MTALAWLEVIQGVLAFPEAVLKLVRAFKSTPQEQHEDLLKRMDTEFEKMKKEGRPLWD